MPALRVQIPKVTVRNVKVGANVFAKDMFGRAAGDVALQALESVSSRDEGDHRFNCADLLVRVSQLTSAMRSRRAAAGRAELLAKKKAH